MKSLNILSVLLVAIVLSSLFAAVHAQNQTITMDSAVQLFENYLTRLANPNLALHEVEEYTNNFYATYYEKDTGIFAFQMIIWKPGSIWTGGMMGNGMSGVVMPEPGPNMLWNTRYGVMGGMMRSYQQTPTTNMTITREHAKAIAQQYLASSFSGTVAGDVDTFYGYYNVDVLSNGKPFGMLSVNGYSGQVWYHSWHGSYIQTVTISEPTPVPEFTSAFVTLIIGLALVSILVKVSPRKRMGIRTSS